MCSSRAALLAVCLAVIAGNARATESAASLMEAGDNTQAYAGLYQAFRERPEDPEVNFRLGSAAQKKGDFEAAVMAFDRVIIHDPANIPARIELARSFLRLGARETARQHCEEMLRGNPPAALRTAIETLLQEIR